MKLFFIILYLHLFLVAEGFIHSRPQLIRSKTPTSVQCSAEQSPEVNTFKARLAADMKEAMRSKEKERLAAIRAIQTALKQKEVDDRAEVNEEGAIAIMAKLIKQRKESMKSYEDAGRQDLVEAEKQELNFIQQYMPQQMSPEDVAKEIDLAIKEAGATTVKDMGKVMAILKTKLAGKADLSEVGGKIKLKLGGK